MHVLVSVFGSVSGSVFCIFVFVSMKNYETICTHTCNVCVFVCLCVCLVLQEMSASEDEAGGGGGGGWWKGLVATPLKALSSLLATGVVVGLGYIVVSSLQEDEDGDVCSTFSCCCLISSLSLVAVAVFCGVSRRCCVMCMMFTTMFCCCC